MCHTCMTCHTCHTKKVNIKMINDDDMFLNDDDHDFIGEKEGEIEVEILSSSSETEDGMSNDTDIDIDIDIDVDTDEEEKEPKIDDMPSDNLEITAITKQMQKISEGIKEKKQELIQLMAQKAVEAHVSQKKRELKAEIREMKKELTRMVKELKNFINPERMHKHNVTIRGLDKETYSKFAKNAKILGNNIGDMVTVAMKKSLETGDEFISGFSDEIPTGVRSRGNHTIIQDLENLELSENDFSVDGPKVILRSIKNLTISKDVNYDRFMERIEKIEQCEVVKLPSNYPKLHIYSLCEQCGSIEFTE